MGLCAGALIHALVPRTNRASRSQVYEHFDHRGEGWEGAFCFVCLESGVRSGVLKGGWSQYPPPFSLSLSRPLFNSFSTQIADVGESRRVDVESTMTQIGTPLWAAPEVLRGDRYDE